MCKDVLLATYINHYLSPQKSGEGSTKVVRGCVSSVAEFCSDQSQSSFVCCYDDKCNHWSIAQNRQLRIALDGMDEEVERELERGRKALEKREREREKEKRKVERVGAQE